MPPFALAVTLAALQLALAVGWLAYAVCLPRLIAEAGLPGSVTPWILLVDQALFSVFDVVLSLAMVSVLRARERAMPLLIPAVLGSALGMLAMPVVSPLGPSALLVALLLWVTCTAALRAPVLVLYARHVPPERHPAGLSVALVGAGLSAALAPLAAEQLKARPPLVGFALSSALLVATVLALTIAERRAPPSPAPPRPGPWTAVELLSVPLVGAGALTLALGAQIHLSLRAGALLGAVLSAQLAQWVLVAAGAAAAVSAEVAGLLAARIPAALLVIAGAVGMVAGVGLAALGEQHGALVAGGVVLASAAASAAGVGSMQAAALAGAPARQGLLLGLWSAVGSLAAALRLGLVASGVAGRVPGIVLDLGTLALLAVSGALFFMLLAAPRPRR